MKASRHSPEHYRSHKLVRRSFPMCLCHSRSSLLQDRRLTTREKITVRAKLAHAANVDASLSKQNSRFLLIG